MPLISLARLAISVTDMSVMTMSAQELTTPTSLVGSVVERTCAMRDLTKVRWWRMRV